MLANEPIDRREHSLRLVDVRRVSGAGQQQSFRRPVDPAGDRVQWLGTAKERGCLPSKARLETDEDLASVRNAPWYQELLK